MNTTLKQVKKAIGNYYNILKENSEPDIVGIIESMCKVAARGEGHSEDWKKYIPQELACLKLRDYDEIRMIKKKFHGLLNSTIFYDIQPTGQAGRFIFVEPDNAHAFFVDWDGKGAPTTDQALSIRDKG